MAKKVINGQEYDLQGTDWQGEINKAVASGDMAAAAQFEAARNEKIASKTYQDNGGKQTATNNYSSYLNTGGSSASNKYAGTDYHQDAIDAAIGGDWDAVLDALNKREEKVTATGQNYGKTSAQIYAELMEQYGQQMPEYNNTRSPQIDAMVDAILNREPFSYDHTTDPTYLAYEQQYKRLGDRAREDTLGDIAALNGGYASSWATSAASQAQNDFNSQLSGIIPELYDAAYNRYLNEDSLKRDDLSILLGLEQTDYDRYRDSVGDYQWQQSFDTSNDQWQQSFDWNKTVDQWNMDMQKVDQLMSKWQMTGVADEEVSEALGVPVGATTESYYFNKAQLSLDQAKLSMSQQQAAKADEAEAAANAEKTATINRIAEQAKTAAQTGAEGLYSGANFILDTMADYKNTIGTTLTYNDYMAIGAQAGIPDYILNDAFYDRADEIAAEGTKPDNTEVKTKTYWKNAAIASGDPEAFLSSNMVTIMSYGIDYIELLYEVMDSY